MRRAFLLLLLLLWSSLARAQTPVALVDLQRPVVLSHALAQGLVGWWRVIPGREGGQTWKSLIGTEVGTFNSMTTAFTTGFQPTNTPYAHGEVRFPGSPSSVTVPGNFVGNLSAFTLVVGYRSTQTTKAYLYAERNNSTNTAVVVLDINETTPGDAALVLLDDASATAAIETGVSVGSNDGKVHYLGGVRVSKSNHIVYVDGKSVATSGNTFGTFTPQARAFGVRPVSASSYVVGGILEVFVYTRALSAHEMQQLYVSAQQGHPTLLRRGPSPTQMLALFPPPPSTTKGLMQWFTSP